jgi:diguanylate cyclase (GGDEF)-like protein
MNSQVFSTYEDYWDAGQRDDGQDPVSGLIGRVGFESRARQCLGMNLRAASALTLIEIDRIETIVALHGANCADMVIRGVAQLLLHEVRGHDVVGRIDTSSFAILHTDIDLAAVRAVGQRLRVAVQSMRFYAEDGSAIPVTVSIGIDGILRTARAQVPDLQSVLARAAARVDEARRAGYNRVVAPDLFSD